MTGLSAKPTKNLKNPNHLFWLPLLALMMISGILGGCAPQATSTQMDNKVQILEQRVVVLEQQKLKTIANLRAEVSEFKKKANRELENFRRSQEFFIEELDKLKQDQELSTNEIEMTQKKLRGSKGKIYELGKRIGDQQMALEEMQRFFKNGIDLSTEKPDKHEAEFEAAYELFKTRSFKKAEVAFLKYRTSHPESELVDDALYFIAYMHSLKGEYNKASLRYFELLKQYPESNRKSDAKWWLGVSLERSGDLNGALDIYRDLINLPPNNPLRIKAQFRLEELTPEE